MHACILITLPVLVVPLLGSMHAVHLRVFAGFFRCEAEKHLESFMWGHEAHCITQVVLTCVGVSVPEVRGWWLCFGGVGVGVGVGAGIIAGVGVGVHGAVVDWAWGVDRTDTVRLSVSVSIALSMSTSASVSSSVAVTVVCVRKYSVSRCCWRTAFSEFATSRPAGRSCFRARFLCNRNPMRACCVSTGVGIGVDVGVGAGVTLDVGVGVVVWGGGVVFVSVAMRVLSSLYSPSYVFPFSKVYLPCRHARTTPQHTPTQTQKHAHNHIRKW